MAITIEQAVRNTNSLAQTFNVTFSPAPTEGNLLIATLWGDEASTDIADITSTGWTRVNTVVGSLGGFDHRLNVWAKFAGAAESTTVAFDMGEVNRRVHGHAVEISGHQFTELDTADAGDQVSNFQDVGGTSNQVDAALTIPIGVIAIAHVGMNNTITASSGSWDSGVTAIDAGYSSNFRGSMIGYLEGADEQQPTASWTGSRANGHQFVVVGVPPPVSTILKGSSFRVSAGA